MSRRSSDGTWRNRPNVVSVRLSDAELTRLDAVSGAAGVKPSTYLREMFLAAQDVHAPVRPSDGPPGAGQRHPGVIGRRTP